MRIGVIIGRIGGIDGVALETEKWITVLERLGHEVHILTGLLEREMPRVTLVPSMSFHHPRTVTEQNNAFFIQEVEEDVFREQFEEDARIIEQGIREWVRKEGIEFLISENASALPCHLAMGLAVYNVLESEGIPALSHDHDFCWERGGRYSSRYGFVQEVISRCFPVNLPNLRHAVINSAAGETLDKRFGIPSVVVPNVMDFNRPFAVRDDYNRKIRQIPGIGEDQILLFQITRIVRRKGIETAIDLVHRLQDERFALVITGCAGDDENNKYFGELQQQVRDLRLEEQVHFAHPWFRNERAVNEDGMPVFSLEDAWAMADATTYFSTYEGFGNAFVEAVLARVPVFVNNYEPVYWPDIGSLGFQTVMIDNGQLTDEAVEEIRRIAVDRDRSERIAGHNFELGRRHFSYEVLQEKLQDLVKIC